MKQAIDSGNGFLIVLGWFITALAVSLGGPFWFDLLSQLVNLRGAGKAPPATNQSG